MSTRYGLRSDLDDDETQPQSLQAWVTRHKTEMILARARAHAELDSVLDQIEAREALSLEALGATIN